jgi:peptidoglycan/LPS O-acetylase OafA/YrhL
VNQGNIAKTLPGGIFGYGWNASLWTLEYEFVCYVLLAVFSVLGLLRRRSLVALIAAIAWFTEVAIVSTPSLSVAVAAPQRPSLGRPGWVPIDDPLAMRVSVGFG